MNKYKIATITIASTLFVLGCNKSPPDNKETIETGSDNHSIDCNSTSNRHCNPNNQQIIIENHKNEQKNYELTSVGLDFFERFKNHYSNEFYKNNYLDYGKLGNLKKYTSIQIHRDYQENEVGANLKYETPFSITGKIRSFSSGIADTPSIHFDVGHDFNGVTAIFKKNQTQFIAKLKKWENIELWCTHSKDFGSSAILHNCITPEEIQNIKNEKISSELNLFLQGKNPNHHILNELFYSIILNERKHPFISCENNIPECIINDINETENKTKQQLKFESSLVKSYALAKVIFLTKKMYGSDFLKKYYLDGHKEFQSTKDLEEFVNSTNDPLRDYRELVASNEEKYKNSKVLQKMKSEHNNIEQFKY